MGWICRTRTYIFARENSFLGSVSYSPSCSLIRVDILSNYKFFMKLVQLLGSQIYKEQNEIIESLEFCFLLVF